MRPRRVRPGDPALAGVLALIRDSFAYMDGVVDPPSSVHRLNAGELERQAGVAEVWCLGGPPVACVVLTPREGVLYVGKLAVAEAQRRRGLARALLDVADERARALGLAALELQVRVELRDNQCAFARLGFAETGRTAHPGHAQPTSVTMRRTVAPG